VHHHSIPFLLVAALLTHASVNANAQAPIPPEVSFKWVVLNENRIFLTKENQNDFQREFCRARYCAHYNRSIGVAAYCEGYKEKGSNSISCPKGRAKLSDMYESWGVFPRSIKTAWDEREARYRTAEGYVSSKRRKIRAYRNNPSDVECRWKLEGEAPSEFLPGSCGNQELDVEYGKDYVLHVEVTDKAALKTIYSRPVRVDDIVILALGDSYSSGEGNPHWLANFEGTGQTYGNQLDQWWDRRCHRSLLNFSSQAVAVASIQSRHLVGPRKISFTYLNYACSGGEIKKSKIAAREGDPPYYSGGLLDKYEGRETIAQLSFLGKRFGVKLPEAAQPEGLLPQIEQAKRDLCVEQGASECQAYRKPEFIVLTIGGNDVGFGPIIAELIDGCGETKGNCATELVDKRFQELRENFQELANALRPLQNEKTRILLMEYPDLTSAGKDRRCDDENFRRVLGPKYLSSIGYWLKVRLASLGYKVTAEEAHWAYTRVLRRLNALLRDVVKENKGWELLGGIEAQSLGRGWCARPSWFVTFDESKAKQGVLPKKGEMNEYFTTGVAHPNLFGHDYIAWRLRCRFAQDELVPKHMVYSEGKGSCQ